MKVTKADLRLYAITDRQWLGGKDFYMVVEQVLKNGATFFSNLYLISCTCQIYRMRRIIYRKDIFA